jgi:hypothetical protein
MEIHTTRLQLISNIAHVPSSSGTRFISPLSQCTRLSFLVAAVSQTSTAAIFRNTFTLSVNVIRVHVLFRLIYLCRSLPFGLWRPVVW